MTAVVEFYSFCFPESQLEVFLVQIAQSWISALAEVLGHSASRVFM